MPNGGYELHATDSPSKSMACPGEGFVRRLDPKEMNFRDRATHDRLALRFDGGPPTCNSLLTVSGLITITATGNVLHNFPIRREAPDFLDRSRPPLPATHRAVDLVAAKLRQEEASTRSTAHPAELRPPAPLVLRRREAASKDGSRARVCRRTLDHPSTRPLRGRLRMRPA